MEAKGCAAGIERSCWPPRLAIRDISLRLSLDKRGYFVKCVGFFFQAEDGIRDLTVTGVQTCALPICESVSAGHPVYWKREAAGRWLRRNFDQWVPLEAHRPVLHVNWWEAEAFCNWAGRRLPTELEWEVAAAGESSDSSKELAGVKRRFPWGDDSPRAEHANLGWRAMGTGDGGAMAADRESVVEGKRVDLGGRR